MKYCILYPTVVKYALLGNNENLVWKWLADIMNEMTTANSGLQGDNVGRMSSLFYANDGAIGSLDHEWLQNANQHLYNLFRDYTGLKPNTENTETMSCQPGAIRGWCLMKDYRRQHKGTGETYNKRKGKRTVCPVPSCGKKLVLGSLKSHLRTQHGMDTSGSIITKSEVLVPRSYKFSFIQQLDPSQHKVPCSVEGYRYTAKTTANLRR